MLDVFYERQQGLTAGQAKRTGTPRRRNSTPQEKIERQLKRDEERALKKQRAEAKTATHIAQRKKLEADGIPIEYAVKNKETAKLYLKDKGRVGSVGLLQSFNDETGKVGCRGTMNMFNITYENVVLAKRAEMPVLAETVKKK